MRRTAQAIEEKKSLSAPRETKRGRHPNSRANLKPFKPGQSGNPSGKPGTDLAGLYARQLFERHPEGIDKPLSSELKGFNAYAYGVLADRAYGKLKETKEITLTGELAMRIENARRRAKKTDG